MGITFPGANKVVALIVLRCTPCLGQFQGVVTPALITNSWIQCIAMEMLLSLDLLPETNGVLFFYTIMTGVDDAICLLNNECCCNLSSNLATCNSAGYFGWLVQACSMLASMLVFSSPATVPQALVLQLVTYFTAHFTRTCEWISLCHFRLSLIRQQLWWASHRATNAFCFLLLSPAPW